MTARVIAIDGPAASGKSSTAGAVARALGALHLDSGALYRGLTRVALDLDSRDPVEIAKAATARGLGLVREGQEIVTVLDGEVAEPVIRSPEVNGAVSEIASLAVLREWVNDRLRATASADAFLVLDGRDIGTAVFPDAGLKIFLTATPEARARRRLAQRGEAFDAVSVAREAAILARRDEIDSTREVAPLRQADDATLIDSTDMTFAEQVEAIVMEARRRGLVTD